MQEALIERVMEEVQRRQQPRAFLLGTAPPCELGWCYVNHEPYEAVVIGSMDAYALLHFPDEICARALLAGLPIFLWEAGLTYRAYQKTTQRVFRAHLLAAERQLHQWGIEFLKPQANTLLTAEAVRRRLREGLPIQGRLTPLARDVLEGRS